MRMKQSAIGVVVMSSFAAGILVAPLLPHAMQSAHAAIAPTAPQIIDVTGKQDADLPLRANSQMRTLTLYDAPEGSIAEQSGTVGKHTHQQSVEIQYILEGSGTMWVGNERKEFKPGELIIIPRGIAHGGSNVAYKALAIKLPPPVAGDTQQVN